MRRAQLIAPRLAVLLVLLVGAAAAGMHLVDANSGAASPQVLLRDARGSVAIDQTMAGRAVVRGDNIRPGEVVRGHTVVENAGGSRARIMLAGGDLQSTMGPDDIPFSDVLQLRVRKRTPRNPRVGPKTLYDGTLGGMPSMRVGVWHPGGHHEFTFRVYYPNGDDVTGASNAWQNSNASISFTWTALPPH